MQRSGASTKRFSITRGDASKAKCVRACDVSHRPPLSWSTLGELVSVGDAWQTKFNRTCDETIMIEKCWECRRGARARRPNDCAALGGVPPSRVHSDMSSGIARREAFDSWRRRPCETMLKTHVDFICSLCGSLPNLWGTQGNAVVFLILHV